MEILIKKTEIPKWFKQVQYDGYSLEHCPQRNTLYIDLNTADGTLRFDIIEPVAADEQDEIKSVVEKHKKARHINHSVLR